jgi:hypothetical protein
MTFFHVDACISRPRVVFVGTDTDIAIANYVYAFIVDQGQRQLRHFESAQKRFGRRMTPNKRRGFIQGFIYGISLQLGERQKANAIEDSRTAIVLAEKQQQRGVYLADLIPSAKSITRRQQKGNTSALWDGFQAGKATPINKPLTATREGQLALMG